MSTEGKREFELRFKGLTDKPLVVAKNDGYLKYPNEIVHVIEKPAYTKAVEALKEISQHRYEANPWTVVVTESAKKAIETLKELGELTGEG